MADSIRWFSEITIDDVPLVGGKNASLGEMERYGLRRGENGLEVYVMCEIPSNVILADQFPEVFDGFSIGSNDLPQLVRRPCAFCRWDKDIHRRGPNCRRRALIRFVECDAGHL